MVRTDITMHFYSQRSRELEEYSPGSRQTTPIDETRTNYAELTFEGVRPHKPPPLDCEVTYTEALAPGERIVSAEMCRLMYLCTAVRPVKILYILLIVYSVAVRVCLWGQEHTPPPPPIVLSPIFWDIYL